MQHKSWRNFLLCAFLILGLAGCGSQRDLSTPASRFVGHWQAPKGGTEGYFVTPIDPSTGVGYYISKLSNGQQKRSPYKVISQDEDGERLVIGLDYASSENYDLHFVMFIPKDGQSLRAAKIGTDESSDGTGIETAAHTYIDNKTQP